MENEVGCQLGVGRLVLVQFGLVCVRNKISRLMGFFVFHLQKELCLPRKTRTQEHRRSLVANLSPTLPTRCHSPMSGT